jgi:S-adenosylmethionine:tRNA ribosyltransferase-isomerase
LFFGDDDSLVAEVIDNTTSRGRTLRFLFDGTHEEFINKVKELGLTPLPKYINREPTPEDTERYQTIYAKHEGSVAAPTAGMHFSKHLMKRLEIKGVDFAELTLHVGLGTFSPVEVEDLSKHKMDSEKIIISQEVADTVNAAKDKKRKIVAVGTTVIRAIESSVSSNNRLNSVEKWTHKFIFPPYNFSIPDAMITNFHTPKSTLMMMTAAFVGYDFLMRAYKEAVKEKYKFFSYGDAMLIL